MPAPEAAEQRIGFCVVMGAKLAVFANMCHNNGGYEGLRKVLKESKGYDSLEDTDVVKGAIVIVSRAALDGIDHFET